MNNGHENYFWEESFGDEKGRPPVEPQASIEYTGSIDASAILQEMLKNTPPIEPLSTEDEAEPGLTAPLMPPIAREEQAAPAPRPTGGAVQSLLLLAEEAEQQARLTAEAAQTANDLAQQLLQELSAEGDATLRQLCLTALKNAYLAAEAAVQAQVSAMETHAAAVNQSLAELEKTKENLHLHSQDFIHLSKQAAQTQEEAALAREKSERARLEYAAKQNAALNNRDALAQAKREYELKLEQTRCAQENLELAQKKARTAHKEYALLKERLDERRGQWKSVRHLAEPAPGKPVPAPTEPAFAKPAFAEPTFAEAATPPVISAEYGEQIERRQIAALTMPLPAPPLPFPVDTDETPAQPFFEEEAKKGGFLRIYGRLLLIALLVVLVLRLFVLDVVMVDGSSMQPTLSSADNLISSKLSYLFRGPQRFDIVLLDAPDEQGYYIKRVIGLPNEEIKFADGHVYIDGIMLDEPFLDDEETNGGTDTVIPDGYYFVMGDNRSASRDSRLDDIGPIAKEHINGKAILRIFPLNKMEIL